MEDLKESKITSIDSFKKKKALPIVATFLNADLNENDYKKTVCKRVETASDGRKYALIATNSNVYKADITDSEQYSDTYVAIHNKSTKEIELIKVQQACFKHVLYENETSSVKVVDSTKALLKEFGGKKAVAAFDKNQRNQLNSRILDDTVDKVFNNLDASNFFDKDISIQSNDANEHAENSIFPEIKESTVGKSVREIFTLSNLIGDNILEHLSEISIEILKMDAKNHEFTNKYIKRAVCGIQVSKKPESKENLDKMCLLIYAESLIHVINNRRKFFDFAKLSKFSTELQEDIIRKFATRGSKESSHYTHQKSIIFYIIMMLLSTDSLQIDLNDLLDSVTLSKKELIKYATVIGCKAKGDLLSISQVNLDKDSKFQVPEMKVKAKGRR